MKIIFTTSNAWLSRAIRWTFKEPVSHVAVVFDENFVMHSNLLGVNLQWFKTFKRHAEVVYSIPYELPLEKEEEIYRSLLDNFGDADYDWRSFFYFAFTGFLYRFFGKPMPKKTPFDNKRAFLCTEWIGVLPHWLTGLADSVPLGITTPYQLYKILKKDVA